MTKEVQQFFSFLLVGALWGCTNPFLRSGSKGILKENNSKTLLNCRFVIPFALNQSGSLVYYYLLGTEEKYLNVLNKNQTWEAGDKN